MFTDASATREWLQTCKPSGTMTSERAVLFWRTVAWHVNVVIVRFGLHVWKSFAGWWTKGCMELESMYADVQEFGTMPLMNLVLSIMDHAAHYKIHPLQTCTDVCSMSWSLSHVQSYRQTNFNTGFISTMLKNSLEITALLHVSANA